MGKVLDLDDSQRIISVKLLKGGLAGAKVVYESSGASASDVSFKDKIAGDFGTPVNGVMLNCLLELRGPLLDMFDYPGEELLRGALVENLEITGVTYSIDKGFILVGVLDASCGSVNLVSSLIQSEEDYEHYGDVIDIVENFFLSTKDYLAKRKHITKAELAQNINAQKPIEGFNKEAFDGLSNDEQNDLINEWALERNIAVLMPEDYGHGEDEEVSTEVGSALPVEDESDSDPFNEAEEAAEEAGSHEDADVAGQEEPDEEGEDDFGV